MTKIKINPVGDPDGVRHLYFRNLGKVEARRLVLKVDRIFKLPFTKVTFSPKGPELVHFGPLTSGFIIAEVTWNPREVTFYKGYLSVGIVLHEMVHLVCGDGEHGPQFKRTFQLVVERCL